MSYSTHVTLALHFTARNFHESTISLCRPSPLSKTPILLPSSVDPPLSSHWWEAVASDAALDLENVEEFLQVAHWLRLTFSIFMCSHEKWEAVSSERGCFTTTPISIIKLTYFRRATSYWRFQASEKPQTITLLYILYPSIFWNHQKCNLSLDVCISLLMGCKL